MKKKQKKLRYTTSGYTFVMYIYIYISKKKVTVNFPGSNPFHERTPHESLPHAGKCLVSERRLAGTNRQKASLALLRAY